MSELLKKLRESVKASFDKADNKADIDRLAAINKAIDDADKDADALEAKNAELVKSYKEVVAHTSFKDEHKPEEAVPGNTAPNLEEMLNDFIEREEKKKEGK